MIQPNLFPSEPEQSPYPGEPSVWIKRLVILPSRKADAIPLRDIEFRLGLNVINTRLKKDPDTTAFGHNVGKSLLVRLIRYCLGDESYANTRVRSRIRTQLSEGFVLALVRLKGEDWGVARSLSSARQSFCLRTVDWHDLLCDQESLSPFTEFEQALTLLRPANLDQIRIGRNNRVPQWTDLLGWLIRDQRCRYTTHNTWRYKDDDSDPDVLLDSDANLIARVMMGLFDKKEYNATEELDKGRATLKQLQGQLSVLRQEQDRMAQLLSDEAGITTDFTEGEIAHAAIRTDIEERRKGHEDQIANLPESKAIAEADDQLQTRRKERDKTEGAIEQRQRDLERLNRELELAQKPDEGAALQAHRRSLSCGQSGCNYLNANSTTPDPTRNDRIKERQDEIKRVESEIAAVTAELDQKKAAVRDAEEVVRTAKASFDRAATELRQKASQCDFLLSRFQKYVLSRKSRSDLETKVQTTESSLKDLERQRESRADSRNRQMAALNRVFQEVMRGLIRRESGKLSLDLRSGLSPNPEASSGEALGSAGRVVVDTGAIVGLAQF